MKALPVILSGLVLALVSGLVCGSLDAEESVTEAMFVVHFRTGPAWRVDVPPHEQASFLDHSSNLGKLRREGKIKFGARYGELGMIFFGAESMEAARAVLDDDPGVKARIFDYDIEPVTIFYRWKD